MSQANEDSVPIYFFADNLVLFVLPSGGELWNPRQYASIRFCIGFPAHERMVQREKTPIDLSTISIQVFPDVKEHPGLLIKGSKPIMQQTPNGLAIRRFSLLTEKLFKVFHERQ